MKLRCVIIDDEPLAVDLLKSYVNQTPFLELIGTYDHALAAMEAIHTSHVQLLFLDIHMPNMNGLEFAKTLPANIKVVFTTAYDQFAVESFRLNALDYLLKPISYTEFLQASKKALEWFQLVEGQRTQSIFVKSGYRIEKINFDDILYIENQKDYVEFHLAGATEPVRSLINMQTLDEQLPQDLFMRVHRSFIVNLSKIKTIEHNRIVFGKTYIPVSDTYKNNFAEFLNKHFFKG